MKKLLSAVLGMIFCLVAGQIVSAKTIQVSALEDFNVANPPQILHVQMNANTRLDYDLMLFQGFQVAGKVTAQNGGFTFVPVSYINYQEENMPITKEYTAIFRGNSGVIRRNQPFFLSFPDNGPDTFQYYVPSVSDMN